MKAAEKYCRAKAKYFRHEVKVLDEYLARMKTSRNFKETDFYVKQLRILRADKHCTYESWILTAERICIARKKSMGVE